jgi:TAT (twin-arginine translocation) pathway signal sequence
LDAIRLRAARAVSIPGETMSDDPQRSDSPSDGDMSRSTIETSRRDFLKASVAVTSASLLGGCLSNSNDATEFTAAQSLQKFQHVLVVMFENRSLDNVLGYLYQPGQVPRNQTYNGIAGVTYSNPVPSYIDDGHTSVSTRRAADVVVA